MRANILLIINDGTVPLVGGRVAVGGEGEVPGPGRGVGYQHLHVQIIAKMCMVF